MNKRPFLIALLLIWSTSPFSITASWEILDLPTDRGFTEICAIDEHNIFVVGDEGLWKTFDGSNWALDTVIPFFEYVYFADDTLGFIGYNHLTTDGGKTWNKVDGTFPGWNIYFPPGQSLLGYGGYSLSGDLNYPRCHLYITTDGGWHWDTLPALPEVYSDSKENIYLSNLSFPTFDTGYVTATCTKIINDSTFEDHTSYFKTTDGGETWVLNEEGLWNDDFRPYLVDFPENATVGYMAGGDGKVFKTTNGGATWDTVLKDRPYIVSMCFPENDQVGYVFGDSLAHKTTDGGKTWQTAYITHDSTFYECHFINNRVGFVTGHKNMALLSMPYDPGFVLKTTDGLLAIAEDEWVDVKPGLIEVVSPPIGSEVTLRYSDHPQGFHAQVYDASGRKVDELNSSETYGAITWGEGSNPGVYFIRVMGVERSKTARVVLVR